MTTHDETTDDVTSSSRVWLLLDVDGVFNVGDDDISNRQAKKAGLKSNSVASNGFRYRIHHRGYKVGSWIRRATFLGYTPAWCTTWEEDANYCLGSLFGISERDYLKSVTMDYSGNPDSAPRSKADSILSFVGKDKFVWVDDQISDYDRLRFAELRGEEGLNNPGGYQLVDTVPATGFTDDTFDLISSYLK